MSAAIAFQVSLSTYLDTYGWLLFRQGKVEQSDSLLRAAAALAPRGEVYAHLAQAESKLGHQELASQYWRESIFMEPGPISQVPPEIVARFESIPTLSVDRTWFPLEARSLTELANDLRTGEPAYFFVRASPDGSVESAQELDSEDQIAKKILSAVRAIPFPVVEAEGSRLPTVRLVRVVKAADGRILAAWSLAPEAVAIASELSPGEFPLPATAPPSDSSAPITSANRASMGLSPARILNNKVPPRYSEEARIARLAGTVLLRCVVGTDGAAHNFEVLHSLGLGLDESAIRAVSAWEFVPGTKDGQPVQTSSTVELNFQLTGQDSKPAAWHLGRVQFGSPEGVTRPTVAKAVAPRASTEGAKAAASVVFEIDEQGAAVNLRVEETSDQGWAKEVVAALRQWKFTPALRDGLPLRVSCTMDFVRGN
jgi:TonB family protein